MHHLILWSNDTAHESHFHMGLIYLLTALLSCVRKSILFLGLLTESWHSEVFYGGKKYNTLYSCQKCICCPFHLEYHQTGEKISLLSSKENKQTMSYSVSYL